MVDKESEHSTTSAEDEIIAYQQKIWDSLSKHYDMVEGAQLSNSFVILMALDQSKIALTTNQISETISKRSKGEIYKNPGTLKDAIDKRLKREGYVNSITAASKTLYSITPKGKKLLKGWIAFLSAYS
jgi:DNA-binding MarR family transcriptional regulator